VLEEVSKPSLASHVSRGVIRWTNPVATPAILMQYSLYPIIYYAEKQDPETFISYIPKALLNSEKHWIFIN
jgi:hypothetical protein